MKFPFWPLSPQIICVTDDEQRCSSHGAGDVGNLPQTSEALHGDRIEIRIRGDGVRLLPRTPCARGEPGLNGRGRGRRRCGRRGLVLWVREEVPVFGASQLPTRRIRVEASFVQLRDRVVQRHRDVSGGLLGRTIGLPELCVAGSKGRVLVELPVTLELGIRLRRGNTGISSRMRRRSPLDLGSLPGSRGLVRRERRGDREIGNERRTPAISVRPKMPSKPNAKERIMRDIVSSRLSLKPLPTADCIIPQPPEFDSPIVIA